MENAAIELISSFATLIQETPEKERELTWRNVRKKGNRREWTGERKGIGVEEWMDGAKWGLARVDE